MKQENSLEVNLNELINIEKEQMRILNEMNMRDSSKEAQQLMNSYAEQSRVTNNENANQVVQSGSIPNMYMYASQNPQGPNFSPPELPPMTYEQISKNSKEQFSNYASNLKSTESNYGIMTSIAPRNSRVSNETRSNTALDAGYRIGQAGIAGLGAAASAGSTWAIGGALAGSGVGGFLGTMALTGAASAGIGLYADAAIDEVKQQAAYRKYLTQNSYKFISPQESENDRDISGFSQDQTKNAAKFLRRLSSDVYLKDEEIMTLTQKFTEGGLLKDTKDLETFKKQMTSLTKSVKTGALILNESYENIAEVLKEFKKLGLDQKDFNATMSGIKVNASNIGVDVSELTQQTVNYLNQLNYGTGNSNSLAYSRLEDVTLYTSEMYNRLQETPDYKKTQQEKSAYNMVKNLGGVNEAAQYINTMQEKIVDNDYIKNQIAAYFFDYDEQKKNWTMNEGKFKDFLSSDKTFGQISQEVAVKLGTLSEKGYGAAVNEFTTNGGTYIRNSMTDGDMTKLIQGTINSFLRDSQYGGNGYDTSKILSDIFQVKDTGAQSLLGNYLNFRVGEGDDLGYTFKQQKKWTEVVNSTKAQTPSIGESISSAWDSAKEWITRVPVSIGDWFGDMSLGISDWWYEQTNGVAIPKLKDTFSLNSLKYGSSSEGIHKEQKDALGLIGNAQDSLMRLSEKGYNINDDILQLTKNASETFSRAITESRERIYNWGQVDEKVAERKDEIVGISATTGLSEVILSALVKYDNTNQTDKVKGSDLKVLAESIKTAVNKYKGNETLGLLQSYAGVNVDDLLKKQFQIDINSELSDQDIEKLKNIKIDDIELSDETKQIIKELLNVDLSKSGKDANGNATANTTGGYAVDYSATGTTQKNEKLIKLAATKYGFSEATFAALLATENESGENQGVNSAGARGAAQLTTSVTGWAGIAQDLVTGETWDGDMAKVTGAENNSMNVSVGAAHFNSYLEKAMGNAFIGYGMYNGGPTGFGNILRGAGYGEDQWSNMTGNQIMEILKTFAPGTEYEKAMQRFIDQLEKVTGDKNVGDVSGSAINTGGDSSSSDVQVDSSGNKYTIKNGVRTFVEESYYDPSKSEEENAKEREKQLGIVTSTTGRSRFDFIKEVQNVVDARQDDYKEMIANLTKKDFNASNYASYMSTMVEKGYSYEQILASSDYKTVKNKALDKGGENIAEILEGINVAIKGWTTFGGSGYNAQKEYGSDELKKSAMQRFLDADDNRNNYVLQKYGESVGLTLSNFDGDMAKYNAALNDTAKTFVQGNVKQLNDFVNWRSNGAEKTDAATMFEELSATDKLALLQSTQLVNNALGKDVTGYSNITQYLQDTIKVDKNTVDEEKAKIIEQKTKERDEIDQKIKNFTTNSSRPNPDVINKLRAEKEALDAELANDGEAVGNTVYSQILGQALLSDKDKELMKYLHKDDKGNVYYDSTVEGDGEMTILDLATWQEQGEKKINYSRAKTMLESENGIILGSLTFDDSIAKAKDLYESSKLEFDKQSTIASVAVSKINDTDLREELNKYYLNNDAAGLKDFLATAVDGKITKDDGTVLDVAGNKDAIDELSSALNKLQNSADIKEIMSLITGLNKLKDSLEDTATAARMTYDSLDDGEKYSADSGIAEQVKTLFKDLADIEDRKTDGDKNEDFQKALEAMKNMTPENIKEAILQGLEDGNGIKIDGQEFKLDQDTMMKLGDIVSENMDKAIKEGLKNDSSYGDGEGSIDKLTSGREKEIAAAMNISVDELKEELSKLAELNSDLAERQDTQTEEYKKLEADRNTTVEEIFKGYSDSMKDYKESAKTATETFSETMAKYDEEVAKAIGVLEDRINNKGFIKQGITDLLSLGWNGLTGFLSNDNPPDGGTARE